MNVYDFDGTIYDGDSSIDFYLFCLKKNPKILRYLLEQIKAATLYKFNKISKTEMKEKFFVFLNDLNIDNILNEFWEKKKTKIKKWYLEKKQKDDLIISASPEFLIRPICEKIGIRNLIASKVNPSTGKFEDENCKGKKKVELFRKIYKDKSIEEFYSDSLSDEPLANIANNAYFVDGDNVEDWPKNKKSKIKSVLKVYLLIYFIILMMYCSIKGAHTIGEWDDYSLPTISIIEQHNISIDNQDIERFKLVFPEWADYFEECFGLSGYTTRNGGQMTWYFPIYSFVCIPLVQLLRFLRLPPTYGFPYTNLALLMAMLIVVYRYLEINDKKKMLLILCLTINPIIFYLNWISAEVFIFSLIGIAMVCWYNKWYKRAALMISLAGMLNPTILSIGIVMIIEYLTKVLKDRREHEEVKKFAIRSVKKIIVYGSCYIIALIPFVYNYYNTGHINLTASISGFTDGKETTFARFIAYLFDFNFGFLPYFSILFLTALFLIPLAICRKQWNYIKWMACFLINVFLYSIMVHINSGMSGIARYNAWGAVIMIFAVCIYFNKTLKKPILKVLTNILLIISTMLTGLIISAYGPMSASNTSSVCMLPIAEKVLNSVPSIYNPLHSTFNSRVNNIDGGYDYPTPIIYCNSEGHVKKILATSEDAEEILNNYTVILGDEKWLKEQVDKLSEKETYISVPFKYIIVKNK